MKTIVRVTELLLVCSSVGVSAIARGADSSGLDAVPNMTSFRHIQR
jgi:hypothetical protein